MNYAAHYRAPVRNALVVLVIIASTPMSHGWQRPPFEGQPSLELPGVAKTADLFAADFDRDGRTDILALSGENGRLTLLVNRATGFVKSAELDAGAGAGGLAVADFNGDDKLDVAVCHHDTDEIRLFMGKPGGEFSIAAPLRVAAKKPHAHMLLTADVDLDRSADLLLAQADDNQVWVLLGDGKGGFRASSGSPFATGNHPYATAVADFNGDGRPDLATPNWHGKSVSVLLGNGKGGFAQAPNSPLSGFASPVAVAAADLTGDGNIDLAICNDDSRTVQILAGDGKGRFARGQVAELEARGDCFSPVVADMNGDGKLDVVATAVNGSPTFSYWLNQANGKFSPPVSLRCPAVASRICIADVNGDKRPDLLAGAWRSDKIHIWFANAVPGK